MERSDWSGIDPGTAPDYSPLWWEELAADCGRAAESFGRSHPDANFFRLAQRIAEERAGLRERPVGLMPLPSGCDDSRPL